MTEFDQNRPVSMTKPDAWAHPAGAPTTHGGVLVPQPMPPASVSPFPAAGYPQPYAQPYAPTTVVRQSNAEIIVAWIFTALTLLYMLPWAIAATRRSTNSIIIAIATFFLSWTVLGWLVLLVLSFLGPTTNSVRATTYVAVPPAPPTGMWAQCPTDPPHVRRWWDGRAWTAHTSPH